MKFIFALRVRRFAALEVRKSLGQALGAESNAVSVAGSAVFMAALTYEIGSVAFG
jgi:hypothetical protein